MIAPPGYGKTALLAEWASLGDHPVAWLTVDDFDNVPSVFLSYLAVAIDRIHPVDASLHAAIVAPGSRILASAVPRLAAELHRLPLPTVLVLDDVHRLVDSTCLDALASLLEHLPPTLQVVVAGRTTPDLPLARLRARRDLIEIGPQELAFDAAETRALAAAAGRPLTDAQATVLTERTEGWAAAIYLATLAAGRRERLPHPAEEVSGRDAFIADYLRSEVIDHLDADDVAFLTRSAVLEVVEPAVAEAVTGQPGAAGRLSRLAQGNQLILEAGGLEAAWRYHNLLKDFLRAELDRREPGLAADLNRRAAAWYAGAGRMELAIEHALHDGGRTAARLVTGITLRALFGGHADRLDRWIGTFDDEAFVGHPPLAAMGAWVHLLNGRPRAAEHLADIVDGAEYSGDPGDGSASFESARALLRSVMARRGPDDLAANAAVALASEPPSSPWRTNALLMMGAAHLLNGDETAADTALAEATDAGGVAGATVAWSTRASLAIARGDWTAARRSAHESHALVLRAQLGHLLPAMLAFAVDARIAIHHGNLVAARDALLRAQLVRPLASEAAPWFSVIALLELARAYVALSDLAGARSVVAEAEVIVRRRPSLGVLNGQVIDLRERLNRASGALPGSTTLTAAELRILPALSTPLTFREIGERLFLSHHTVKTHAISIYAKLQAGSRSEAVERAIEIGLLEPFPTLPTRPREPAG